MSALILENYILIVSLLFFVSCTIFSLLINRVLIRYSSNIQPQNSSNSSVVRWASTTKPSVGGITFYLVFLIAAASHSIFFDSSAKLLNLDQIGLLIVAALSFLLGLADDTYNTKPILKLITQATIGIVLIATGIHIHIFDHKLINYTLTLIWVVGIMNSINMLDNMDGITSIVSAFILFSAIIVMFSFGSVDSMYLLVSIGVLASLIGFLKFNWHPSKIYMGDTGSQFLGVFLAIIGIKYFWNDVDSIVGVSVSKQILLVALAFILPIVDTTVVVINRLARGQSPFKGGKDHTTHSLAHLGLSDRQVAYTFIIISLISTSLIIIIRYYIESWAHPYTFIFAGYILTIMATFFYTTRHKLHEQKVNSNVQKELKTTEK